MSFRTIKPRRTTPLLAGAVLTALALAAPGQQPPPPPGEVFRVEVDVVSLYCTVKDKQGGLVTNLEPGDFEIREDGKLQEVKYFARETDRPLTLALLVDTSISQGALLPAEKEAATQFLRQVLRPSDLALLITFDIDVDLLQDFTSEIERLEKGLDRARINSPADTGLNPGPFPRNRTLGTRLYDAVYLASREKLAPEVGRKAIILVSDGVDAGSSVDEKRATEAAHRGDSMIYAIGIADPVFYQVRGHFYTGSDVMKKMAEETGGRAFFPDNAEELQKAFDEIAAELRSQYSLGYTPTNTKHDGRFRKVEIKVKRPGLRVQARRGYYAPAS
jgi:VWFA-related protein